jgi:hypothetical protein
MRGQEAEKFGINATTSQRTRDDRSGGDGNGNGHRKCRMLPSRDLATTALTLIVDNTNGSNGGIAIISCIFLRQGQGSKIIQSFICC